VEDHTPAPAGRELHGSGRSAGVGHAALGARAFITTLPPTLGESIAAVEASAALAITVTTAKSRWVS
jgi:hypothetical protein